MVVWQAYKYVYYWLYTWFRNKWGDSDVPEVNAAIGMSLSLICNLGSLSVLIYSFTGIDFFPSSISKLHVLIAGVIILIFHEIVFRYNGKFKGLDNEFKNESVKKKRKKGRLAAFYVFGSVGFYIFLLFFGVWIEG